MYCVYYALTEEAQAFETVSSCYVHIPHSHHTRHTSHPHHPPWSNHPTNNC